MTRPVYGCVGGEGTWGRNHRNTGRSMGRDQTRQFAPSSVSPPSMTKKIGGKDREFGQPRWLVRREEMKISWAGRAWARWAARWAHRRDIPSPAPRESQLLMRPSFRKSFAHLLCHLNEAPGSSLQLAGLLAVLRDPVGAATPGGRPTRAGALESSFASFQVGGGGRRESGMKRNGLFNCWWTISVNYCTRTSSPSF